jgi:peptidoglycan/LPS O-acetylase OafA/YrhL
MGMAAGGRGPEREWSALALAALGAFVACLVVLPEHEATPWYLTVAMATAAGVFVVAASVLLAQPFLRRRRSAPPP